MSVSFDQTEDDGVLPLRTRTSLSKFLDTKEHVARCVRSIDIRSSQGKATDVKEVEKFKSVLPKLTALKLVR